MSRICIDLDGVIANFKQPGQTYADVEPIVGARERLAEWKAQGHYIIVNTARHMKTCQGNIGLVNARIAEITLTWMREHQIPYDEIHFGKPWADIYIDDNAHRFHAWTELPVKGDELPRNKERMLEDSRK